MRTSHLLLPLLFSLGCQSTAPIATFPPVHAASQPYRTRAAILIGMQDRGWRPESETGRSLVAWIAVRTHVARVAITYDEQWIRFAYQDSENMDHDAAKSRIHPAYNRWVLSLRNAVAAAVAVAESIDPPPAPGSSPTPK
jgi:hypothetical protein